MGQEVVRVTKDLTCGLPWQLGSGLPTNSPNRNLCPCRPEHRDLPYSKNLLYQALLGTSRRWCRDGELKAKAPTGMVQWGPMSFLSPSFGSQRGMLTLP